MSVIGNAEKSQSALKGLTCDSILRNTVRRLPLFFALVWLAIYAGRNGTMVVRMEEDYAYKEAISTAFEGYPHLGRCD